ncbi:LacI family transcriptional regulator [Enterococcus florum]|uniref:LacI family transcriptional regulator n=1 Tax=Enterococcus florum TaxID=2480627 RepID=A0A4P5PAD7_9ENTE|nr:LacI family DNA-binding transcriptional regulator [Enterococcus florum]GCF95065.1 LacI family transcriptional regulator [Enterococcus florum]
MANIRDIAKRTGYSVSMVSRVINQHPYVDETKRQEILAVMKELNYVPNHTAQNLSYGKTKNIGVIVPFVNHPYYERIVKGVTQAAFPEQYKVTLLPTNYDPAAERSYLDELAAKSFDGVIIASKANSVEVIQEYLPYGKIVLCEDVTIEGLSTVFVDRKGSFAEALHYMKDQGVKRIGVTLGRSGTKSNNSKIALDFCEALFPDFDPRFVKIGCQDGEDGLKAAAFFQGHKVDGIFSNGDEVAAGLIEGYKEQQPPLIVGQENLFISRVMGFPTIDHQLPLCGKRAFEILLADEIQRIKIPYRFIQNQK